MNIEKLRSLVPYIREQLAMRRDDGKKKFYFSMDTWGGELVEGPLDGYCGTVACAAGYTVLREGVPPKELWNMSERCITDVDTRAEVFMSTKTVPGRAAKALGLTCKQAKSLFITGRWPSDLAQDYYRAAASPHDERAEKRLKVLEKRIERLIEEETRR